jgi:hypothetical protein
MTISLNEVENLPLPPHRFRARDCPLGPASRGTANELESGRTSDVDARGHWRRPRSPAKPVRAGRAYDIPVTEAGGDGGEGGALHN